MSLLSELDKIDRMKDSGEISQEEHDRLSEQVVNKYSKKDNVKKIACIALIFAILSIGISENIVASFNNTTINITAGTQWVVNNTNLAPSVPGEHVGTGERVGDNTTYWNNNTPIELFIWAHANNTGNIAEIHLFINDTKVADVSGKPLGVAEQNNKSIVATIPQYSKYSVEIVSAHHYEWREYPILTGNVTTSINTSSGNGSCNCNLTGIESNISILQTNITQLQSNDTHTVAHGNYTGDGTTNRFIPYDLGFAAHKIDIFSSGTDSHMGVIIFPGNIYSYRNGVPVSVTDHNSTGFFVSGLYNQVSSNFSSSIGSTATHSAPSTGNIYYFPFKATADANIITIGVNSFSAAGNARFGVYNSTVDGSAPRNLLNETGSVPLSTGWTNVSLIAPITDTYDYFLAMQTNNASENVYYCTTCGNQRNQVQAYGAFPATASSSAGGSVIWNMAVNITAPTLSYDWVAI